MFSRKQDRCLTFAQMQICHTLLVSGDLLTNLSTLDCEYRATKFTQTYMYACLAVHHACLILPKCTTDNASLLKTYCAQAFTSSKILVPIPASTDNHAQFDPYQLAKRSVPAGCYPRSRN